jgi:non-heme chloroperoxidase
LYRAGTKGQIFLCIHSITLSACSFAVLAKELKYDFQIAAYDLKGHGLSEKFDEEEMTIETFVDEALEVLDHIAMTSGNTNIVLAGHGLGGAIATKVIEKSIELKHKSSSLIQGGLFSIINQA